MKKIFSALLALTMMFTSSCAFATTFDDTVVDYITEELGAKSYTTTPLTDITIGYTVIHHTNKETYIKLSIDEPVSKFIIWYNGDVYAWSVNYDFFTLTDAFNLYEELCLDYDIDTMDLDWLDCRVMITASQFNSKEEFIQFITESIWTK